MSELAALLAELAAAPTLPAARCAGRHELFDRTIDGAVTGPAAGAEVAAARTQALALCAACPELTPCRAWVDSLRPKDRPLGVVAGLLIPPRPPRRKPPRKETTAA